MDTLTLDTIREAGIDTGRIEITGHPADPTADNGWWTGHHPALPPGPARFVLTSTDGQSRIIFGWDGEDDVWFSRSEELTESGWLADSDPQQHEDLADMLGLVRLWTR